MPKSGRDAGNPSVERDVRSMERKKRVTEVLEDNFRNELEGVVVSQKEGNKPLFHAGIKINSGRGSPEFKGLAGVRQVNDLNGALRDRYSKAERELRCKLAALYRLTAMFEWDHLIYSHITARLPGEEEYYLINAYGMQYSEVTASSLVKIDKDANIIDPGSTLLPVNKAGWKLNSALHSTGRNIVYHTHSHAGTAISAMKCGLLNLCQEALIVRPVSYGTYQGFVPSVPEQDQLKADLEPDSNVMILENHGLVSVGKTIEETFLWMAQLTKACEIQWRVLRTGRDNLTDRTSDENKAFEGDLPVELVCSPQGKEYGPGELEFESYMRKLDNNGANTGYPYKTPTLFKDQLPSYPAVQYPPIVPGMEGSPSESDSDRSRPSASQRSAWFKNPTPVEQRMTPPSSDNNSSKGKADSKDKKLQPPKKFAPFDAVVASPRSDSRTGSGSSSSSSKKKKRRKKKKSTGQQPDFSFIDDLAAKMRAAEGSDSSSDVPPPRPPLPDSDHSSDVSHEFIPEHTVTGSPISEYPHERTSPYSSKTSSSLTSDSRDSMGLVSRKKPGAPDRSAYSDHRSTDGSGHELVLADGKPFQKPGHGKHSSDSSDDDAPTRPPPPPIYSLLDDDSKSSADDSKPPDGTKPSDRKQPAGDRSSDGRSSDDSSVGYHSTRSAAESYAEGEELETTTCEYLAEHSVQSEMFFDGEPIGDDKIDDSDGSMVKVGSVHSLDSTDKSLDVVVSADLEDMPTVEADTVDQVEQVPYFSRDVTVDTKMSVTVDSDVEHNVTKEVDIRVGEDGVTVAEEIVQHTVTTSIVEITEVQEEEFEVITVRPGQLTEEQKEELRRQGYVLQEEQ